MAWKEFPHWLKGGLIGLVASVVYLVILMFLQMTNFGREALSGGLSILFFPVQLVVNFWCNTFVFPTQSGGQFSCNVFVPWLIFILIAVIIGSVIGFIVYKIKKE